MGPKDRPPFYFLLYTFSALTSPGVLRMPLESACCISLHFPENSRIPWSIASYRAMRQLSSSVGCTVGEEATSRRNKRFSVVPYDMEASFIKRSLHRGRKRHVTPQRVLFRSQIWFFFPSALFSCILFSQKALHSIKIAGIYDLDLFFGTIF